MEYLERFFLISGSVFFVLASLIMIGFLTGELEWRYRR